MLPPVRFIPLGIGIFCRMLAVVVSDCLFFTWIFLYWLNLSVFVLLFGPDIGLDRRYQRFLRGILPLQHLQDSLVYCARSDDVVNDDSL